MRLWVVEVRSQVVGVWSPWVPLVLSVFRHRPTAWDKARDMRITRPYEQYRVKPWVREGLPTPIFWSMISRPSGVALSFDV